MRDTNKSLFMKKLKFLAFALFTVLACVNLASCSDDDEGEPQDANLVGTWIASGVDEEDGERFESTVIFNEDGTGSQLWYGEDEDEDFRYTYDSTTLTIHWEYGETDVYTVNWKNRNKFTVGSDGYYVTFVRK